MKITTKILIFSGLLSVAGSALAQPPNPPAGKRWEKIEALSDEFNGGFNTSKWSSNDPQWAGRQPGFFTRDSVSVAGGNLRITADLLSNNEKRPGYTHQGGLVRSLTKVKYGYFEARMKANKTFLSSTFWLINKRNEGSGCDVRTTELDVVEVVGENSGNKGWIDNIMRTMNANTHSRNLACGGNVGQKKNKASLGGLASSKYYTYGVWWKGPKEVIFYLDGKQVGKVTPPSNFNLDMYLRMVVETYDWNPPPSGGGMNKSFDARTTYYDWVRSYRLVNGNGGGGNTGGGNTGGGNNGGGNNGGSNNVGGNGTFACTNNNNNAQQCKTATGKQSAWCNVWNNGKTKNICFCGGSGPCKGNTGGGNTGGNSGGGNSNTGGGQDLSCTTTDQCKSKTGKNGAWCNVWNNGFPKNVCRCGTTDCK